MVDAVDRPMYRARAVGLRFIHIGAGPNLIKGGLAVSRLNEASKRIRLSLRPNRRRGNHNENGKNAFHAVAKCKITSS